MLYCTVGRGLEPFCLIELQNIGAKVESSVEGKIFFLFDHNETKKSKTAAHVIPNSTLEKAITLRPPQEPMTSSVLRLKTIERVFVCAHHGAQVLDKTNRALTAFQLQRLLTEQVPWKECVCVWRQHHPEIPKEPIPFKVNVRLSGSFRRLLQPASISRSVAQRLANITGLFSPNPRRPLLAIDLHISEEHLTAGLSLTLTSQSISGPSYGLRSTTSSAMVMCLMLDTGSGNLSTDLSQSVILDPMCGKGGVLRELPNNCVAFGVDIDEKQLKLASRNVKNGLLVQGDARRLPFERSSINHIICDVPFGQNFSSEAELALLLPLVLREMGRVSVTGGKIVLLSATSQLKLLDENVGEKWALSSRHNLALGLTDAAISVYLS